MDSVGPNSVVSGETDQSQSPAGVRSNVQRAALDTWTGRDWVWVGLITAIAFLFRLYHLTYRSLWTDEFHTLGPAQMPLFEMLRERISAGHFPTYFLMMKGWVSFAGTSDWALRFPSAVIGTLLVPVTVLLARRYLSKPFVYVLAIVAACNGFVVWSSQEARMYSALSVAGTMVHLLYLRTLEDNRRSLWGWYFFWLFLGITIQPLMLVHFFGHLVASLWLRCDYPSHARVMKRIAIALPFVAIPGIVVYALVQQKAGLRFDVQNPALIGRHLAKLAFGNTGHYEWFRAVTVLLGIVATVGLVRSWRAGRFDVVPRMLARFCCAATFTPLLVLWVVEWFVPSVAGQEKYFIPAVVPVWILTCWGIWSFRGEMRVALIIAGAFLVSVGLVGQWRDRGQHGRELVHHIVKNAREGDIVLLRPSGSALAMLEHYGAGHLKCVAIRDTNTPDEILANLKEVTRGYSRAWLFSYRAQHKKNLHAVILQHPELFKPIDREKFHDTTYAILLELRHSEPSETTGTVH